MDTQIKFLGFLMSFNRLFKHWLKVDKPLKSIHVTLYLSHNWFRLYLPIKARKTCSRRFTPLRFCRCFFLSHVGLSVNVLSVSWCVGRFVHCLLI